MAEKREEMTAEQIEAAEDQALSEAFQRATADGVEEEEASESAENAEDEAAESGGEKAEKDAEKEDDTGEEEGGEAETPPTDLPTGVQEAWKEIPESAREAIKTSQRDMGRRLSEQGRQLQAITPIRDVLAKATQDNPAISDMKPEQVAEEAMTLARYSAQFREKPVETLVGLARHHGVEDRLSQAYAGGENGQGGDAQTISELRDEIGGLKRQLQNVSDPEARRQEIAEVTQQNRIVDEIQEFAQQADYWAAVEPHMPAMIEQVKQEGVVNEPKQVLSTAYERVMNEVMPKPKAPDAAGEKAQPKADPDKTEAAQKAKSVNVSSKPSGKPREQTEEEALTAAYRAAASR